MNPSPSRSPDRSIQSSAASACGHSPSTTRVVAGPGVELAEQDEPERGRIDAAVVRAVWRLARTSHLAGAQFVQDLAGLGVAPRVVSGRLEPGEDLEGGLGERRDEGHGLQGGDDAVAPEQRREPRDAGGEVLLAGLRAVVVQRVKVGDRAAQGPVEELMVGPDVRHLEARGVRRRRLGDVR